MVIMNGKDYRRRAEEFMKKQKIVEIMNNLLNKYIENTKNAKNVRPDEDTQYDLLSRELVHQPKKSQMRLQIY